MQVLIFIAQIMACFIDSKRYIGHLKYEKPRAAIIRSPQKILFFFHSADVRDGI